MIRLFYPYEHLESVHEIDYKKLKDLGYKAVIFDIDNTLVHHGDDSTREIDQMFKEISNIGLKTFLLSNNGESRIKSFIKNIDTKYISNASKPRTKNYKAALKELGLTKKEVVFVGDQIFTDILGANMAGIPNILVKFIVKDINAPIGKRRELENVILKWYKKNKKFQNRIGI